MSSNNFASLFAAQTTDADSTLTITIPEKPGGAALPKAALTLYASGGFGGGTCTIKVSHDNSTFHTVGSGLTAAGIETVEVVAKYIKLNLTGATAATLTASLMVGDIKGATAA